MHNKFIVSENQQFVYIKYKINIKINIIKDYTIQLILNLDIQ